MTRKDYVIIIAVYGSLRVGEFNHDPDTMKHLATTKIEGWLLRDTGYGYPTAHRAVKDLTLVVDVLEVSPETFCKINNMEMAAGYTLETVQPMPGVTAFMWPSDGWWGGLDNKPIMSGDWSAYIKTTRKDNHATAIRLPSRYQAD